MFTLPPREIAEDPVTMALGALADNAPEPLVNALLDMDRKEARRLVERMLQAAFEALARKHTPAS